MYKISVIVPVHNGEEYLGASVQSILNQSLDSGEIEIVLVNNLSSDNSLQLCQSYAEQNSNVKVLDLDRAGLSIARNAGIKAAQGEYLCFVDADDTLNTGALNAAHKLASSENADVLLYGYNRIVEENGEVVASYPTAYRDCVLNGASEISSVLLELKEKDLIDSTCNKLYKADIIKTTGIRMPVGEIFEDTQFNLELLHHVKKLVISSACHYNYFQRGNESLTKSYNAQKAPLLKKRNQTLRDYFIASGTYTADVESRCNYFYIKYMFSCFFDLFFTASGFKRSQRMQYISAEINTPEFKKSAANALAIGKMEKVVLAIAKSGNKQLVYSFSKLMFMLKYRFKNLYNKLK